MKKALFLLITSFTFSFANSPSALSNLTSEHKQVNTTHNNLFELDKYKFFKRHI